MTDTKSLPVLPVNEDADAAFEAWWREYQQHRTLTVKVTTGRWVPATEIERLTARIAELESALAAISLDEYESTSSASEKVHGHARIARKALYGDKP